MIPNKIEMSVLLQLDTNATDKSISELHHASRFQLRRARLALSEGRQIGKIGRPRKLSETSEKELVSTVLDSKKSGGNDRFPSLSK